MTAAQDSTTPRESGGQLPARAYEALARDLLGGEGTRLAHVRTAGFVATQLSVPFEPEDDELLIAAALLHDIGYSARIAHTGFHPLDGGDFLRAQGYPARLARLVANHSLACMTAPSYGIADLAERFPREDGLLTDALAYANMHSDPDGQLIHPEHRLAEVAHRHSDRANSERAAQLRAAIARVSMALLDADPGPRRNPPRVPVAGGQWRWCPGVPTVDRALRLPTPQLTRQPSDIGTHN